MKNHLMLGLIVCVLLMGAVGCASAPSQWSQASFDELVPPVPEECISACDNAARIAIDHEIQVQNGTSGFNLSPMEKSIIAEAILRQHRARCVPACTQDVTGAKAICLAQAASVSQLQHCP